MKHTYRYFLKTFHPIKDLPPHPSKHFEVYPLSPTLQNCNALGPLNLEEIQYLQLLPFVVCFPPVWGVEYPPVWWVGYDKEMCAVNDFPLTLKVVLDA